MKTYVLPKSQSKEERENVSGGHWTVTMYTHMC